jgi:hypothetical protein
MGGAKDGNLPPGLGEGGCVGGMRVDDSADFGKRQEEPAVRGRVG